MARSRVMCEIDPVSKSVIRIFSSSKKAYAFEPEKVIELPRAEAVGRIRKQIWERCGGHCEECGKPVKENGDLFSRMHMHERIPKGKFDRETNTFGEVSLDNGLSLCYTCHLGPSGAHSNRRLRFGETNVRNNES